MAPTVLCADVDRHLFQILEKALREEGYRALAAHDGNQALAVVQEESPDLAILDITLPKRDGFEVLEAIRALPGPAGQTPVLLTSTSRINHPYQERAERLGAQALLAKPVPLDELIAKVREIVKAPAKASRRRSRGEGPKVEGSLSDVDFPHLLHHLHGLRATGVLMIESGKKRKAIQLRDGYAVAVKSNLVNECLGNYLVRRGMLSQDALRESLARMKKGEGLQGQILVAMDVITEDEITEALREQARDKLFEIFGWRRGSFRLEIGSRLKRGNTLALETSPANVIIEGVRRFFPIEAIDAFISQHAGSYAARGESPFYRFQEIDLTAGERALVEELDGQRPLRELVGHDENARRTIYGLVVTDMIHLRQSAGERAQATAGPRAAAPVTRTRSSADEDRRLRSELAAMAERLRGKSFFEMLDVAEDAPAQRVEMAYERLAKKAHPDRFQNASEAVRQLANEVFGLLSKAQETLADPKRRTHYLMQHKRGRRTAAKRAEQDQTVQAEMEFQLGEQMLRQRDYERALAHFAKARNLAPREGEYLAHYGWTLHLCNPDNSTVVQEALTHVKRSVKLARDQEKPYLFLGRLCKVVGDGDAAERMFTRAVQIRPDCVEAMRELRLINLRRDKGRGLIGRLLRR